MKRLVAVTLLLILASNLCLADYELTGTLYPLRWGQQEGSADLVTPANALGNPLCVKMGSGFGCRLRLSGGGNVLGWKVSNARLVSRTNGQVYWTVNDPGVGNLISPSATYSLPNIPSLVDYARLEMSFVIYYWGPWGPVYYITPLYSSEEVFIVLDEPKAPMSPAWVSLLRYSCWWGRGTNNLDDAAQAITFGVFFQRPGFAYPSDADAHWLVGPPYYSTYTFMLKALLDQWNAGTWTKGNCVDVSCFTMLALCSLGMDFSTRQLTGTMFSPPHPYAGSFYTNPICLIGSDPTLDWTYSRSYWIFHQVCVLTGDPPPPSNTGIWDPTGAQKEDLNGNGYRNPPAHHPNHLWPEFDYWQKPRVQGASLGLVNTPQQDLADPQYPNFPPFWALGTWKCGVSANTYTPPP